VKTILETTENCILQIHDCGLSDYREVLQQQHELREKRRRGEIPDTVLIVEHPAVITLGARQSANKLLTSREDLAQKDIDVVESRRGGGTTAHNPGQLVFYPILHLQELGLGISEYIRKLEAIGAELLQQLGVRSRRRKGFPGLWVGDKKIASIGARVSKFVTYHGMAINIQNDLSIFDFIVPCGLDGVEITSVRKETGRRYSMSQVKGKLSQLLIKHFSTSNEPRITSDERRKLPPWLRRPLPAGETYNRTDNVLSSLGLETICNNANCPNRGECWSRGTATVLILGNICTRSCRFCSVGSGKPAPPDPTEPTRIAEMAKQMGLKYLVITSVNRDDLPDGGASHFRDCINEVRQQCPDIHPVRNSQTDKNTARREKISNGVKFEILTPDFRNCQARALKILRDALPFVFAHNIETVPSLYPIVRAGGNYQRSLNLLKMAGETLRGVYPQAKRRAQGDSFEIVTKSSIMLGLGETDAEVEQVLKDLRNVGCDRITIGQYLKPSRNSLEVVEYATPAKFDWWKQKAASLGFRWVMSSPFARSSYFAEQENTL
jgi:lipoic acid synthetase